MNNEVLKTFKAAGAIKEGHFLLASGLHSPVYWEKFRILQHPQLTEKLCRLIAQHFKGQKIDVVAGPTTGGIILAFETARRLGARSIFAEKEGKVRAFRRDFEITPGEQILLVDDIITRGATIIGSASRLHEAFPDSQIRAFAVLRTVSGPLKFTGIVSPTIGDIELTEAGDAFRHP